MRTTIGTRLLPFGITRRPARLTPAPWNFVSVTSNAIRLPFTPSKLISPLAQSEKETRFPSGRSVQPSVLVQLPSLSSVSSPVVPSLRRQRKWGPSVGPISTSVPSCRWYVPIRQSPVRSSAAIALLSCEHEHRRHYNCCRNLHFHVSMRCAAHPEWIQNLIVNP